MAANLCDHHHQQQQRQQHRSSLASTTRSIIFTFNLGPHRHHHQHHLRLLQPTTIMAVRASTRNASSIDHRHSDQQQPTPTPSPSSSLDNSSSHKQHHVTNHLHLHFLETTPCSPPRPVHHHQPHANSTNNHVSRTSIFIARLTANSNMLMLTPHHSLVTTTLNKEGRRGRGRLREERKNRRGTRGRETELESRRKGMEMISSFEL